MNHKNLEAIKASPAILIDSRVILDEQAMFSQYKSQRICPNKLKNLLAKI